MLWYLKLLRTWDQDDALMRGKTHCVFAPPVESNKNVVTHNFLTSFLSSQCLRPKSYVSLFRCCHHDNVESMVCWSYQSTREDTNDHLVRSLSLWNLVRQELGYGLRINKNRPQYWNFLLQWTAQETKTKTSNFLVSIERFQEPTYSEVLVVTTWHKNYSSKLHDLHLMPFCLRSTAPDRSKLESLHFKTNQCTKYKQNKALLLGESAVHRRMFWLPVVLCTRPVAAKSLKNCIQLCHAAWFINQMPLSNIGCELIWNTTFSAEIPLNEGLQLHVHVFTQKSYHNDYIQIFFSDVCKNTAFFHCPCQSVSVFLLAWCRSVNNFIVESSCGFPQFLSAPRCISFSCVACSDYSEETNGKKWKMVQTPQMT